MANEEHVAILKQGVEVWYEWIKERRSETASFRADLSEATLSGASLGGAKLLRANLSGATLSGATLREADLREANLIFADLRGANLFKATLSGATLIRATLSGATLIRADLRGTDLRGATLKEANLIRANLFKANLSDANLRGTYLRGAGLKRADLRWADLSRANLREANLREATLSRANLRGATLSEASCAYTQFSDVDLSETLGLETIDHRGPSYIDIATLYKSQGKIPEVFLRGCGVPDDFITFIPSLTNNAFDFYSCFISYSHQDQAFAQRVYDTLQGRGIRCWLDEKQLNPGEEIYTAVDRGIRVWDKVILCASQASLTSWWVDNELNNLFAKERRLEEERGEKVFALIPLDLDGYLFSDACDSGKKQIITSRNVADFKKWEHDNAIFEREIERVIKALRTDGGKIPDPPPKL